MIQKFFIAFFLSLTALAYDNTNLPSKSIYQLDQKWTTEKNKIFSLSDLSGAPTVITMVFTSCPGACPLLISDMKSFDRELKSGERKKIHYAAFSIDPDRDTPEALQKFFKKMKLNDRWTLLTSTKDQVRDMAAILGFSYKYLGDADFTHSTSLFLISSQGEILSRKERGDDWKDFLRKFRSEINRK